MKYIKRFNESEEYDYPNTITVKFNGDGFMNQYWKGTEGDKVYQADGFASNLIQLQQFDWNDHSSYGDGGLEMRKGSYYPLFKVFDKKNLKNSIWYYIVYIDDEINIMQSSEHSEQGVKIPNHFDSLKNITHNWYCKFDEGVKPGSKDHRGFFEIVSVS
jgi:hypothetical protein